MAAVEQRTVPRRLSPFFNKEAFLGAKFAQDEFGWVRAERFTDPGEEKRTAERGVGVGDVSHLIKLSVQSYGVAEVVSGLYQKKEQTLVNRTVLTDGPGELKEVLCAVLCKDEGMFVMNPSSKEAFDKLVETNSLEHFIVADVTSVFAGAYIIGEKSRPVLWKLTELNVNSEDFPNFRVTHSPLRHVPSIVMRFDLHGVPGYQIYFERAYIEYMWDVIFGAGREFGITPLGSAAMEFLGWRLG
jgi:glycine cleavage system aminomethyltransferase T